MNTPKLHPLGFISTPARLAELEQVRREHMGYGSHMAGIPNVLAVELVRLWIAEDAEAREKGTGSREGVDKP